MHTFWESSAIISIFLAIYLCIALYDIQMAIFSSTSHGIDPVVGSFGIAMADLLLHVCGYGAFLLPLMLFAYAYATYDVTFDLSYRFASLVSGWLCMMFSLEGLFHVCLPPLSVMTASSGGVIGFYIADTLMHYCNMWGAIIILSALGIVGLNLVANILAPVLAYHVYCINQLFSFIVISCKSLFDTSFTESSQAKEAVVVKPVVRADPNFGDVIVSSRSPKIRVQKTANRSAKAVAKSDVSLKIVASENAKPQKEPPTPQSDVVVIKDAVSGIPPLELVHMQMDTRAAREDPARIAQLCKALEARLLDYGVQCKVLQALPGPVITRYELELAAGTKASKVSNLAKDLARSLSVRSVRVIEVIPGKTCIGIEIPNHKRQTVALHEILESNNYQNSKAKLTLALGVDISGEAVVADLTKMPHLLVAGTTGSGKSVGINGLLLSLLFKASPSQLRLILIDPKMLELAVYDGIAHLLTPVVTDMRDAASALHWCVSEMERRYKIMSEVGVRNIDGYNARFSKRDAEEKLPFIVVIVDEFADMMMMVGKKVEQLIARLAQKARAAGIHLILATQRPSVDVITGLIKANIPTRMAYQVSSKIDSRTIIDQQGAEALLGAGDMLYLAPGSCIPTRCHSAFVTDKAVLDVVKHLKEHCGAPEYIESIVTAEEEAGDLMLGNTSHHKSSSDDDALYDEAVEFVVQSRRASISGVQRRLRIGYNRAATLVEKMEQNGVVSSMDNSGQRTVLAAKIKED